MKRAIARIVPRKDNQGEDILLRHWDVGRLVKKLVKERGDRPGSRSLAKELGVEFTRLKASRSIFRAFPSPVARDRLVAMRRADGSPVPFWAVARLCSPALADDRDALLERACREGWSESDVDDELRASRGTNPINRAGGRKHGPPGSLQHDLARWQRQADGLARSVKAASRPDVITDLLASPDAAEVSAARVLEVRRSVERAVAALMAGFEALDRIAAGLPGAGPSVAADPGTAHGGPKPRRTKRHPRGSPG